MRPLNRRGFVGGAYGFIARTTTATPTDALVSIAVTFDDDGSSTTSGTTFRPTASTHRCQAVATGTYSISGDVDITDQVTWSSGTVAAATVSNGSGTEGEITAVSANNGTDGAAYATVITATLGAISGDETLSIDTARDATSSIRCPSNAYQWTTLLGYTPTNLYLCQEASGDLADSIGSNTLTAANTPGYSASVTGWTRTAVTTANGTGARFSHSTFADSSTTSILAIVYGAYNSATVAAGSQFLVFGGNNDCGLTSGDSANELKLRYREGSNIAEGSNALTNGTAYPWVLRRNVTASEVDAYSDTEKLSPTFGAAAGTVLALGSAAGTVSGPFSYLYAAVITGAGAEISDATVKAILVALGWTIGWS